MKTKQIIKKLRKMGPLFNDEKIIITEAANRLEMLSVEQKKLHAKLAAMKAERDAAMADIEVCCQTCAFSTFNNRTGELCKYRCYCDDEYSHWEWSGAKDTNVPSKEDQP